MTSTDFLKESLTFWLAIGCLIVGVKTQKLLIYITSFFCLIGAGFLALIMDGSSGAFGFSGAYFILFSIVAFTLSSRLSEAGRVSKSGLQGLAALILILGIFCFGIL